MFWYAVSLLLVTTIPAVGSTGQELAHHKPSLVLYTVNDCQECDQVQGVWGELQEVEQQHTLIDQVNCDYHEAPCLLHTVTTFPTVLFVSNNGIREYDEEEYTVDNLLQFIDTSIAVIINGESVLSEEEEDIVFLENQEDLDILGKTHSLVYFMYDEDAGDVEEFVLTLRDHVEEEFSLPVYVIPCGDMTEICVNEPFFVKDLPCIKYLGEKIVPYKGDLEVEKIEKWLQVTVFKTVGEVGPAAELHRADKEEAYVEEGEEELEIGYDESVAETSNTPKHTPIDSKTDNENVSKLVYLNKGTFHNTLLQYRAVLVAFLDQESVRLEQVFAELNVTHKDTADLLVCAVRCDAEPTLCSGLEAIPTVKHGFSGKLVREVPYRTKESLNKHIEKIKIVLVKGKEILLEEEEKEEKATPPPEEKVQQIEKRDTEHTPEVEKKEEKVTDEKSGHVLIITSDNYNNTLANNKLVFIKFFVPWCGHCQKLKPTWKMLGHSFRDVTDIVIGMLNCQNERALCKLHLVSSYPTLFVFIDGEQTYRYRENRALNNFIEYVKEKYYLSVEDDLKYSPHPFKLTAGNIWNVLGTRKYTVTLFTASACLSCEQQLGYLTTGWSTVRRSEDMFAQIMLATVDCDEYIDLCLEVGVPKIPYMKLYDNTDEVKGEVKGVKVLVPFRKLQQSVNALERSFDINVLKNSIEKAKSKAKQNQAEKEAKDKVIENKTTDETKQPDVTEDKHPKSETDKEATSPKSEADKGAKSPKSEAVTELGSDNFKRTLKLSRFTLVKFHAPWCGHCRKLAPVWKKLGEEFISERAVILGKVNCDTQEALCDKFNVASYPTLIMFENDKKLKHKCKKHKEADLRTYISSFLSKPPPTAPSTPQSPEPPQKNLHKINNGVLNLNPTTLPQHNSATDYVFVMFYSPVSCPKCTTFSLTWDRLADMYLEEKRVVLGRVDCEEEGALCSSYQVTAYPALLMFDNVSGKQEVCTKRAEYDLTAYIDSFVERKKTGKDEL